MVQGTCLGDLISKSGLTLETIARRIGSSQSSLSHQMVRGCSEKYYQKILKAINTVEMLKEYIDKHCEECSNSGAEWCIKNSTYQDRIQYAQQYGCICGTDCSVCKYAKDCGN